mmetsp:Transcript_18559/g.32219  ORF Transcript_18559/g.32219 Transcript_18559/m.32219 type:complete len:82 (+) Transcript_18559:80-325(+)
MAHLSVIQDIAQSVQTSMMILAAIPSILPSYLLRLRPPRLIVRHVSSSPTPNLYHGENLQDGRCHGLESAADEFPTEHCAS